MRPPSHLLPALLVLEGQPVTGLSDTEEWMSSKEKVPYLLEDELKKRGGVYRSAFPFGSHVEISGRLVTGQNPGSTRELAEAVGRLLSAPVPSS